MMKSISPNLDALKQIGALANANRNLRRILADLNEPLLLAVIEILLQFDTATKRLSTDISPTIHLVIATKYRLTGYLTHDENDTEVIIELKKHLLCQLDQYFKINTLHTEAALLYLPIKNNTSLITVQERTTAI